MVMMMSSVGTLLAIILAISAVGLAEPVRASNAIHAAPYLMPLDDAQDIDEILNQSGLRHFVLAFVLATNQGECVPTWNGLANRKVAEDRTVAIMVEKIRNRGGDVSVSFGGYNGVELGHACRTVEELAAAYQSVIDKYRLTHVDFDIEGEDLGVVEEESRRFAAIRLLKERARERGDKLIVSLTMPTTMVGANEAGKEEIKRGLHQQADVDLYTLMAFDFGGTAENQAKQVITVMESFHQQLRALLPQLSESEVYRRTGMILMNGHTDQPSELYTTRVFRDLVHYAQTHQLARVSFWSINRDRACPAGRNLAWAVSFCSSVPQTPYEFSQILATFHQGPDDHNHHRTDAPPTSSTSPAPVDDVDCSKVHDGDQQFFPYRTDRHKYIWCYQGKAHVLTCPAGLVFNMQIKACDWDHELLDV